MHPCGHLSPQMPQITCDQPVLQGNEFSYYMLLASAFLLNHSAATEQWTVYPWALSSCNQVSDAEQLRAVRCASPLPLSISCHCVVSHSSLPLPDHQALKRNLLQRLGVAG